jgi:type III pantothenate kinase
MKILAIDVGNTRTRLAVVEGRKVSDMLAYQTAQVEEITKTFKSLNDKYPIPKGLPVVICSVVPEMTDRLVEVAESAMDFKPHIIGKNIPLPLKLDLKDTQRVGPDRVVSAAMAFERMGKAVAVASFGTAITIDCVNDDGVFLGGTILPGLQTAARALAEHTALLPLVDLTVPETPWGRDTTEAISAGILFGAVGALREIVERYATALGHWPELIVTGGDGLAIAQNCDFVHAVVPDLLLMGIELTYELWCRQEKE